MEQILPLDNGRYQELARIAQQEDISVEELVRQIVDNQLDTQTPRRQALEAYNCALTEREQDIVWKLRDYRLMTRGQIGNIFSTTPHNESADSYAGECLSSLVRHNLATEHEIVFTVPGRKERRFYALSPEGVFTTEYLRRGPNVVIRKVREPFSPKLLTPKRLAHHLCIVDVASSFSSVRNRPVGELAEWEHDQEVLFRFPWRGSVRQIRPDGRGLWYDGELHSFLVEVVRSRQLSHLIKQVKNYCFWWESGAYQKDEGTPFVPPILFVATSQFYRDVFRGIINGALAAHVTIQKASKNLLFGLARLDDVVQEGPCAPIWHLPLQGVGELGFNQVLELANR